MAKIMVVTVMAVLMASAAFAAGSTPYFGGAARQTGIAQLGTPHVGAAQVADIGMLRLDAGFDYGSGINFNGQNQDDFSSLQLLVNGGYGLMDNVEVGGRIAYESNSGKFSGDAPLFTDTASKEVDIDDNGLEYLAMYGKYLFNQQFAVEASVSFANDNKIYHGMDGVDFGIKGLLTQNMGVGTLNAELGWTAKSGDHNLGGVPSQFAQELTGYENVFSYGVGFEYPYQNDLTFLGEIYGYQSPYDKWSQSASAAAGGDNFLALDLGAKYQLQSDLLANGTVGFGLSDGAPAFSVYLGITKLFDMDGGARRGTPGNYQQPAGPSSQAQSSYQQPAGQQSYSNPPVAAPQLSTAEKARQALERGNTAFSARDYATAAAAYREATSYDQNNNLAYFNLGVSYYSMGRYSEAASAYQSAAQLNPSDVDAHLWLGMSFHQLGDSAKAISEWKQVLQLDPNNQTAQNNLKALGAY